ncbi:GST N-terminal domain-containing protein [Psidium guajava]|nr:GST N-terminal domain-containing protein [Psidium guajava]
MKKCTGNWKHQKEGSNDLIRSGVVTRLGTHGDTSIDNYWAASPTVQRINVSYPTLAFPPYKWDPAFSLVSPRKALFSSVQIT